MRFQSEAEVPDKLHLEEEKISLGADIADFEVDAEAETVPGSFVVVGVGGPSAVSTVFIQLGTILSHKIVIYNIGADMVEMVPPREVRQLTGMFLRRIEIASLRTRVLKQARDLHQQKKGRFSVGADYAYPKGEIKSILSRRGMLVEAEWRKMAEGFFESDAAPSEDEKVAFSSTAKHSKNKFAEMAEKSIDRGNKVRPNADFSDFEKHCQEMKEDIEKTQKMSNYAEELDFREAKSVQ